jgi:hypothetical protein
MFLAQVQVAKPFCQNEVSCVSRHIPGNTNVGHSQFRDTAPEQKAGSLVSRLTGNISSNSIYQNGYPNNRNRRALVSLSLLRDYTNV